MSASQSSPAWIIIVQAFVFQRVTVQKGVVKADGLRAGHGLDRDNPTPRAHTFHESRWQRQCLSRLDFDLAGNLEELFCHRQSLRASGHVSNFTL
jgi:hypothetical protein